MKKETIQNRVAIAHEDRGEGESALLFLPGWCESRGVFARLIDRLQSSRRILALDLPGHGESPMSATDFGFDDIATAAIEVVDQAKLQRVIPVAHSHAGWVAIELCRRLGARVSKLVLLDWIVLDPPSPFFAALKALQERDRWRETREELFAIWLGTSAPSAVTHHVRDDMGSFEAEMWARAGREIAHDYELWGNPLKELSALRQSVQTVHIYGQPRDDVYLTAQLEFASSHPWFSVRRVDATTHFSTLEDPEGVASTICDFLM
jgi:pimeloyl-ACP methyl ester carboxylesterase